MSYFAQSLESEIIRLSTVSGVGAQALIVYLFVVESLLRNPALRNERLPKWSDREQKQY